jgi:hypothetical protein
LITNRFPYPISMYWHEENREPDSNGIIKPGGSMRITSFIGHIFGATKVGSKGPYDEILDWFVVNGAAYGEGRLAIQDLLIAMQMRCNWVALAILMQLYCNVIAM